MGINGFKDAELLLKTDNIGSFISCCHAAFKKLNMETHFDAGSSCNINCGSLHFKNPTKNKRKTCTF